MSPEFLIGIAVALLQMLGLHTLTRIEKSLAHHEREISEIKINCAKNGGYHVRTV
jgi:hypothetical protein